MTPIQSSLLAVLALLAVAAAVQDLRRRIIPDRLNVAIALLAPCWWWASGLGPAAIAAQALVAILVFALFAGLFAIGMIGGGDVKMIGALGLWLPPLLLLEMLVLMVLAGGLISIAALAWHAVRRPSGPAEVPYGVAIAAATLFVLTHDLLTVPAA